MLVLLPLAAPATADAQQGVYLPPAPNGPGGEDSIETANGARCRQSINSNGAYLDLGVTGSASSGGGGYYNLLPGLGTAGSRSSQNGTGYARITVPLGRRPERIDCSRIYEMELQRLKRELELLKMAAE